MDFSFVFTVFFMLLGPVKIIPAFAALTRGADSRFKRSVAIQGALIAAVLCAVVALAGGMILSKFRISLEGARIAGGLVLLIAALQVMFRKAPVQNPGSGTPSALQLAVSPVAIPLIVPQAGIAAILISIMLMPDQPGLAQTVYTCLAIVMVLDFLVMYFNEWIMKTPGLLLVLNVLGSVLIFVQLCMSVETILNGLRGLGIIRV